MLEKFNIKNQKGVGISICLFLIPPLSAIFACYFWLRPSLARRPCFHITDRFSLGSSLFWGMFILIIGSILSLPFLLEPLRGPGIYVLFMPLAGLFLLLHRRKYQKYTKLIDQFLVTLERKNSFTKSNFCFNYSGKQYSYDEVRPFMTDLYYCDILKFQEDGDTVNYWFAGEEPVMYEDKAWVCASCGAENKQKVIVGEPVSCEYCKTSLI